ncbi:MAG: hypothetical protein ABEI78_00375 [Candidatus Nanohaloarchaea archaeon]
MSREYKRDAFNSEIGYQIARLVYNPHSAEKIDYDKMEEEAEEPFKGLYPSAIVKELDAADSTIRNYITGLETLGIIKKGEKIGRKRFYEFDQEGMTKLWISIMVLYSDKKLTNREIVDKEVKGNYPVKKAEDLLSEDKYTVSKKLDDLTSQHKYDMVSKLIKGYENQKAIQVFLKSWIKYYFAYNRSSSLKNMLVDDMWKVLISKKDLSDIDEGKKEHLIEKAGNKREAKDAFDISEELGEKRIFPEQLTPIYEVLELIKGETRSLKLESVFQDVWYSIIKEDSSAGDPFDEEDFDFSDVLVEYEENEE